LTNQLDVLVQGSEICERFIVRTLESTAESLGTSCGVGSFTKPDKKKGKKGKK
jgi:hypothetical protein